LLRLLQNVLLSEWRSSGRLPTGNTACGPQVGGYRHYASAIGFHQ
jgi:hypothetical protein